MRSRATLSLLRSLVLDARSVVSADEKERYLHHRVVMSSPPPSPNAKLERAYTAAKDREKIEIAKSGLASEAAQGNIAVVLERLLRLDQRVDPRDVPAVYKRALLRFHPDRHVGKPIAKRASYEERYVRYILPRKLAKKSIPERARSVRVFLLRAQI